MKPQTSSLNPYAAAYIPLSKREAAGRTSLTEKDSKNYDGTVWFQTHHETANDQKHIDSSSERLLKPDAFLVKSQPASSSYTSPSRNAAELTDKQLLDEDLDMDIECLRMAFPGISDQSLLDVYNVNQGDLDAAIDMLSQLEYGVESSGSLPETLDIGDVSESGLSSDSASLKQKNVAGEASASSSHMASANVS
ncbi:polyadenylate-binding protein-interacting protein 5-like [Abrus precatorius]|uniref:Polyadenylate-binding protein-interacting protein 5-like n=1 Tax=Abrus precatorius TaxID=3816 RepID=A0A8B8JN80_ABRPR|nr:polyadenylate-binding protein-interacting protein 5-like [Abrus precatorius]XP_027332107.1 polyadenylate-binding protein-interacting protein 5-like [Abrus precatorius]XP_027332108.1 polyadenylate-binding protein-interacting protein 5-like [Abrus precatorius]